MGDRKVAIVFREVPGEPHMALVTYTETLNQHIHDPMMACIESDIGQNSPNLADALNRTHTKDGKYILQVLHQEGLLKKVQTSQIIVTPNSTTKIRLDELNKILSEMEQGSAATKRLAEMDESTVGLVNDVVGAAAIPKGVPGVLEDSALAKQRIAQAQRMEAEAKGLLAEAQRLMDEAKSMDPSLAKPEKKTSTKKPKVKVTT
jgi:hypothetical protein